MRLKVLLAVCVGGALCSYFAGSGLRLLLSGRPMERSSFHGGEGATSQMDAEADEKEETSAPDSLDSLHKAAAAAATPADSRVLILETLRHLNAKQLERLIGKHLENPELERLVRYDFQAALRRLGEVHPQKAADVWVSSLPKTVSLRRHLAALLEPWMQKSPKDFFAWHALQSEEAQKAMASVVGQFAFSRPELFGELADALSSSPVGAVSARRAIEGLRVRSAGTPDLAVALEYARQLPEGKMRSAALVALAEWPGVDVSAVPEIQTALGGLPYAAREAKAVQLVPKAEKLEPGLLRQATVAAAMEAEAIKDSVAAAKRLKAMIGGPDYPAAVRGFVEAVSEKDPTVALEFCLTLPKGDEQRGIALDEAAAQLFRKKPDQARKWVEQAALTEEEFFRLTGRRK